MDYFSVSLSFDFVSVISFCHPSKALSVTSWCSAPLRRTQTLALRSVLFTLCWRGMSGFHHAGFTMQLQPSLWPHPREANNTNNRKRYEPEYVTITVN